MESIDLVSPKDAARLLHIKKQTLAVWRCAKRRSLPYVKVGRRVFYRRKDLEKFIERNLHTGKAA